MYRVNIMYILLVFKYPCFALWKVDDKSVYWCNRWRYHQDSSINKCWGYPSSSLPYTKMSASQWPLVLALLVFVRFKGNLCYSRHVWLRFVVKYLCKFPLLWRANASFWLPVVYFEALCVTVRTTNHYQLGPILAITADLFLRLGTATLTGNECLAQTGRICRTERYCARGNNNTGLQDLLLQQKKPTAVFFCPLLSFALRHRMSAAATGGFKPRGGCGDRAVLLGAWEEKERETEATACSDRFRPGEGSVFLTNGRSPGERDTN